MASFNGVDSRFFSLMIVNSLAFDNLLTFSQTANTSFLEPVIIALIMSVTLNLTRSNVTRSFYLKDLPILTSRLRIIISFSASIHQRNRVLQLANLISAASSLGIYFSLRSPRQRILISVLLKLCSWQIRFCSSSLYQVFYDQSFETRALRISEESQALSSSQKTRPSTRVTTLKVYFSQTTYGRRMNSYISSTHLITTRNIYGDLMSKDFELRSVNRATFSGNLRPIL